MAAMEGYSNVGTTGGANFDDLDLEGGSVIDEWHEGDPEFKKEEFKETDNIRYLLKNCTVPLDNGKNGLVFTADYTRGARYTCHVCNAHMFGVREFNIHVNGQSHCSGMEKNNHPYRNFPRLAEDTLLDTQVELGEPAPPGMEDELQPRPCQIQAQLDSIRSVPIMGLEYMIEVVESGEVKSYWCLLCDKQGTLGNILKHFTSFRHSITYLGLYFPRVYRAMNSVPKLPAYRRGTAIILNRILKRIEGKFGRLKPKPCAYNQFTEGKADLLAAIRKEFHFRESPEDEFDKLVKNEEILSRQFTPLDEGPVTQIVDPVVPNSNKKSLFKSTKINVTKEKMRTDREESPECVIVSDDKPPIGKDNKVPGGSKRLGGPPYVAADRYKWQTSSSVNPSNKGKLGSLSPVSGGSIGSERRSRSRSRSRSPVSHYRRYSRSPDHRRYRQGYRSRSRNRSRSPVSHNRSRSPMSHNRSKSPRSRNRSRSPMTHNRSRSPVSHNRSRSPVSHNRSRSPVSHNRSRSPRSRNRSRSPRSRNNGRRSRSGHRSRSPFRRQPRPRSRSRSRNRLNLPYRRKPSYSRSRSRSPVSRFFQYRPQASRLSDEENKRWEIYKKDLKALNEKLKFHEKAPEKHPKYPAEWKEFWSRRYKEIQASGKDPSKHDFKPEWIAYWKKRMIELHNIEAADLKAKLRESTEKIELEEEVKEVTVSDIKNTWKALTGSEIMGPELESHKSKRPAVEKGPPGTRKGFIPFTDDSSKVISVLRLITVLECNLGVLAPKVMALLSKALSMEKIKPGSSENILYNEEDCVLFETVKEKLKGLFFAGLVERHLVNTTKFTIKSIEDLMSKAPKSFGKSVDPVAAVPKSFEPVSKPPPVKQVTVEGIGTVDRMAIAEQIATALISQGRTDVSEQELESLIDAVVASSQEDSTPPSVSTSSQPSGALNLLQSAYGEGETDADRMDHDILSKTLPLIDSVDVISEISDYDLRILVEHFFRLQPVNQTKVVSYLKKLVKTAFHRIERLKKSTSVNLEKLYAAGSRISPFSSRTGTTNPGISEVLSIHDDDDDDDDDYSYEDIYRAASEKVKNDRDQQMHKDQPTSHYSNNVGNWRPPR